MRGPSPISLELQRVTRHIERIARRREKLTERIRELPENDPSKIALLHRAERLLEGERWWIDVLRAGGEIAASMRFASEALELRDYCNRRGWTDVEEISDTVSGTKSSRKGLDRLMAAVRRGKVDVVVCFKLDRLGRSLQHLAQLIGEFKTHKVALVVPGQGIDTSEGSPVGKLQLHVLGAVAEFEAEIIRERVNAGLAAARKKGVRLGRPPSLSPHYGDVARLRSQGMSGRAIAAELKIPSSTAFKIIGQLKPLAAAA